MSTFEKITQEVIIKNKVLIQSQEAAFHMWIKQFNYSLSALMQHPEAISVDNFSWGLDQDTRESDMSSSKHVITVTIHQSIFFITTTQ